MDLALLERINGLSVHRAALDRLGIFSAKYLILVFVLALIGLWFTRRRELQRAAILASISALLALGLAQLMGLAYPRPRPYLAHHVHLLIARTNDTSFPSDHATFSFAIAVMIWQFNRRLGSVLLVIALWICWARVFVGAHYPTDVAAGAALGSLLSAFMIWLDAHTRLRSLLDQLLSLLARWRLA